jgi:hypothetical protein
MGAEGQIFKDCNPSHTAHGRAAAEPRFSHLPSQPADSRVSEQTNAS